MTETNNTHDHSEAINQAVTEAMLTTLLGGTQNVPYADPNTGQIFYSSDHVDGALKTRLAAMAAEGAFDDVITAAVNQIDTKELAKALIRPLTDAIGKFSADDRWNRPEIEGRFRRLTQDMITNAISEDPEIVDKMKSRIGRHIDTDKIDVAVNLTPVETPDA